MLTSAVLEPAGEILDPCLSDAGKEIVNAAGLELDDSHAKGDLFNPSNFFKQGTLLNPTVHHYDEYGYGDTGYILIRTPDHSWDDNRDVIAYIDIVKTTSFVDDRRIFITTATLAPIRTSGEKAREQMFAMACAADLFLDQRIVRIIDTTRISEATATDPLLMDALKAMKMKTISR
ncbi:MAG TPA: hypothetical protein VGZ00_01910 [Candidatus Baltobacteraceae bacterium]|nr:hypothetical protein [Candidatus Baltobacteraceae bacterium]